MILIYFLAAFVISSFIFYQKERKNVNLLAGGFIVIQFIFLFYTIKNKDLTSLNFFTFDSLGLIFFSVLSLLSATTLYYSIGYLDEETISQYRIYFISFILLCASITGAYFSNNATLSWILIEVTTIAAALLIYHRRTPRALEAAWKYVLLCSIGIALAYLGILFLSIMLKGQHELNLSYESLRIAAQTANPLHLKIAFLLIFIGYSAKMEVFPLYPVGIDANHAVPTPMSAFFSTALVNLGFVSIFRIYNVVSVSEIAGWAQYVLLTAGIISVVVAAVYLLQVTHYKRLFTYSTVENMGIVLIAMALGKTGLFIAIFHVVMHSFIKSASFYSLSGVGKIYGSYKMESIGGYWKIYPTGAVILTLCLIGLTAIPPSSLFISEFMLFKQLFTLNRWIIFVFLAISLCFILYALLSKILHINYSPLPIGINKTDKNGYCQNFLIYALLLLFFYIGIFQPQWFITIIDEILVAFNPMILINC